MARKKQTFDPHALTREVVSATHEVVTVPFRLRTYRVIRKILIIFIAVSIVNVVFANVFYTPKMYRILRENSELVFKYRLLQDKIRAEQRKLDEIHHRDNFVYRALFSADTLNIGGIYTPYPASKYAALAGDEYAPLMIGTWQQLDAFGRQLYRTSVSFDELQILAKNKENMSTAIPAIWPIDRQALRRGIEPFGYRNHPIYHRRILHKGIDLAANIGNNVYATGDATVQSTDLGQPRRGYGKQILLNHQYRTSVSFDELQILAKNKENMSTAIPAIWPIDRQALRRGIEPFGYRNHPIYHRRILHKGIDLAANIGNNVYATGDATVQSTDLGQPRRGYGKQILLNHQYGYQTRYAHLSQIFVKPGEKVVRGQLIGKVGNTGGVTGPHLHYEVIHMGQVVNPINYFNRNMTNEEYERLMEQMQELNLDTFDE